MRKFFILLAALLFGAVFSGCVQVDPESFAEIFQLEKNQKLYTAYNIWYTDPNDISSLNIQQGTFLPVGTEIEPVRLTADEKVIFKAGGKTYTISFNSGFRLCSVRDFVEYTFTTQIRQAQFENIPPKAQNRIVRGEVVPGMDRRQVLLSYGPPPAIRTPDVKNETWIYWVSGSKTIRLVFRGDVVRRMLDVDL